MYTPHNAQNSGYSFTRGQKNRVSKYLVTGDYTFNKWISWSTKYKKWFISHNNNSGQKFTPETQRRRCGTQDENNLTSKIRNWNKNTKREERGKTSHVIREIKRTRKWFNRRFSRISARAGVEQRPKFMLSTPHTTNPTNYDQTMVTSTHTYLWNKHANPVPWPCDRNSTARARTRR